MSSFKSARARLDFWLFATATFLLFTTNSMLALLSLVMKEKRWSADLIGVVLSSPALPIVLTMLLAGLVITRFGALKVATGGAVVMLVSYLSFELTTDSLAPAVTSRVAHGFGYALFMPAAMIYADAKLTPQHRIYYFGIYASMFPLPNILGPWLAETYLRQFGTEHFFLYTVLPAALGAILLLLLKPSPRASVQRASLIEYAHLLKNRALWAPYCGVFVVGMFYGVAVNFMALLLESRGVPVAYFFVSFTACLFGSRFLLVRYVQRLPRSLIIAGGLTLLTVAYALLAFIPEPNVTIACGILFGLGYSVAYPTLSIWVAQQYDSDRQGMPLALFNALFTFGIFLLPLIGGYVIAWLGFPQMLLGMAVAGALTASAILLTHGGRAARRQTVPRTNG